MSSQIVTCEELGSILTKENYNIVVVTLNDFTTIKYGYNEVSKIKDFGVLGYAFGKRNGYLIGCFWLKKDSKYFVEQLSNRKIEELTTYFLHHEIASGKKLNEVI